jgi:Fe-Mn family superoxide dismutase
VPATIRTQIRNHGGGHANHSLFWETLIPAAKQKAPSGRFAAAVSSTFGGQTKLEEGLRTTAASVFGSGWAWLSLDRTGKLTLHSLPNQDSPLSNGFRPLLGLDVWEHAYYLKYQNRRPDYLAALLKVINWEVVSASFEELSR